MFDVERSMFDVSSVNIGSRLTEVAREMPDAVAVAMPLAGQLSGRRRYRQVTFRQLDEDSNSLAAGLVRMGVRPAARLVLMVPPSIDFISLAFALFKAGAVAVLIDPGMGRTRLLRCLEEVNPDGFVAIPLVHALRTLLARRFPMARWNVTVGRRWFWTGATINQLRRQPSSSFEPVRTSPEDPAAIIFTTGSTGPPKGVLYRHGNFDCQVDEIQNHYRIQRGDIDLPGFPLFALFNGAMGVTTVVPEMNPTRPARVDARRIIEAVHDWKITQAFGSPAMWNVVGRYCEQHAIRLPTLRRVLSAGAPVPPDVLRRMKNAIAEDGEVYTPYGATEALPVASISASEVLHHTAPRTHDGRGTCVGRKFGGIQWKIIAINDGPIKSIDSVKELPAGHIGELIVRGRVVTDCYVTRTETNALAKIRDGNHAWHRMGDVGYLDDEGRFWFCGRKNHRVTASRGTMYSVCCEAIFNQHECVERSALVGIGSPGEQTPIVVVQPRADRAPKNKKQRRQFVSELARMANQHPNTACIGPSQILIRRSLPVDIRHNAKICREKLAIWAKSRVRST